MIFKGSSFAVSNQGDKVSNKMAELDSSSTRAEQYIWENMGRQLEKQGQGEAAGQLQHHLRALLENVKEEPGGLRVYRFELQHRVSDYSVKLNANDGSLMGWQFSLLGEDSRGDVGSERAQAAANEAAQLPPNAFLETARFEDAADRKVFLARWIHKENDVPVERDYIQVLVNSKTARAFFFSRKWHTVDPELTIR